MYAVGASCHNSQQFQFICVAVLKTVLQISVFMHVYEEMPAQLVKVSLTLKSE